MPLDEGVRRARLALQEGAASLHAVLHHLQGVLIGCRADRQIHRQIKTNLSRQPKTVITLNSLQPKPQLWQIIIPHSNYQRGAGTQWLRPTQHWRRVLSTERWLRYALSFLKPLSGRQRRSEGRRLTVGVESSTLADGVPVLDVLPPASSKGVRPVLPNKERKES